MIPKDFRGRAARLADHDLPRVGHMIGVGEDEIHAVLEVEARGCGFDAFGRPTMLFEPHLFWRELGSQPGKRARAAAMGLAYERWGTKPYPADSYPRLTQAMAIDETAALRSASWGLGQLLGSNHRAAGYDTPQAMVAAFCDSEVAQLEGMAGFIRAGGLDRHLRAHAWGAFARLFNGPGYAANRYDARLAAAYAKWAKIKDTPWAPALAAAETVANDPSAPHVVSPPAPAFLNDSGGRDGFDEFSASVEREKQIAAPAAAPAPPPGFLSRLAAALAKRFSA